jgi:hypothetical protein
VKNVKGGGHQDKKPRTMDPNQGIKIDFEGSEVMIQIDPNNIGEVDRAPEEVIGRERRVAMEASKKPKKEKKKMQGRNKAGKKHKKKMQNIVMDEKAKARETKNRAAAAAVRAGKSARGAGGAGKGEGKGKGKATVAPSAAAETGALGRFSRSQAKS